MKKFKESLWPEVIGIAFMLILLIALLQPGKSVKADNGTQLYCVTVYHIHGKHSKEVLSPEEAESAMANNKHGTVYTETTAYEPSQPVAISVPSKQDGDYFDGWSIVAKGGVPFFPYKNFNKENNNVELGFTMPKTDLDIMVFYDDTPWEQTMITYIDGVKVDESKNYSESPNYSFNVNTEFQRVAKRENKNAVIYAMFTEGKAENASIEMSSKMQNGSYAHIGCDTTLYVYGVTGHPLTASIPISYGTKTWTVAPGVPTLFTVEDPTNIIKNVETQNGAQVLGVYHQSDKTYNSYTPYGLVKVMAPYGVESDELDVIYHDYTWSNAKTNKIESPIEPAENGVMSTGRLEIMQEGNKIIIDADDIHNNRNRIIQLEKQLNNIKFIKIGTNYYMQIGDDETTRRLIK